MSEDAAPAVITTREGLAVERVVFFSDAVFAIAITLLVIDLRLPDAAATGSEADLFAALGRLIPRVFAYVLSFAVIGLYWLAHWRRYQFIERVDERLLALNLLLLGFIAFIPFPTSLIGEHGDVPGIVVIYGLTLSAAGLIGSTTWVYANRARLVRSDVTQADVRFALLRGTAVPVVLLLSLAVLPLVGPYAVEVSWLLILPVQVLIGRWIRPPHPV